METTALQLAFEALNIKKKAEVILPAFTIISCILPVIRCGAVPVLVDSDPITWNMDVNKIEDKNYIQNKGYHCSTYLRTSCRYGSTFKNCKKI